MYAIATFFIVAVISMLFTRMATGALIATGLPPEVASFQARSAFTGTGFTTVEAENVVNHPVRRKILATAMLIGNLGTPTLVVTVLVGLMAPGPGDTPDRLLVFVAGSAVLLGVLSIRPVTAALVRVGEGYARSRLMPAVDSEFTETMDLGDGFIVAEVGLSGHPDHGPRSLRGIDQALRNERLLGVRRRGPGGRTTFLGESPEDIDLGPDDVLVIFGSRDAIFGLVASEVS